MMMGLTVKSSENGWETGVELEDDETEIAVATAVMAPETEMEMEAGPMQDLHRNGTAKVCRSKTTP